MAYNAATQTDTSIPAIPLRDVLPWAIFGGLLLLLAIYFVGAEQGATAVFKGMYVHEFVHDGRHLLGFPSRKGSASGKQTNATQVARSA